MAITLSPHIQINYCSSGKIYEKGEEQMLKKEVIFNNHEIRQHPQFLRRCQAL